MSYVMIGLICSALGCKWVPASDETFIDQATCQYRADCLKPLTAMYFDLKCEPAKPAAQS